MPRITSVEAITVGLVVTAKIGILLQQDVIIIKCGGAIRN